MKGKTAIVTGASKGLGFELVKQLLDQGVNVAACARNISTLEDYCKSQGVDEAHCFFASVDVVDEGAIVDFVAAANDKFKSIDYLFNNVGMNTAKGQIFEINTKDYDDMYAVNMRAPMIFTREVSRLMIAGEMAGVIINLQSTCCLFSNETAGSYTATKCGFDALSKVFKKELRDYKIKVINVYPGGIDTPFREADRPDYLHPESVATTIMAQLQLPDEVFLDDIVLRPLVERNFA